MCTGGTKKSGWQTTVTPVTVKEDGSAELAAIYLHPQYQGKGIGSALLKRGIEELSGVRSVWINVEKENWSGLSFYAAKGFEVVREFEEDFDGHVLKTVRMELIVAK